MEAIQAIQYDQLSTASRGFMEWLILIGLILGMIIIAVGTMVLVAWWVDK